MDAVELARQIASELHARAVAVGQDPWRPYDFAVAEVKRRDLDVEPTAKGAAILNKGRATFIASERLILHEDAGSRFEQAFLIAHEIGHVALGDDPSDEAALDVDPERSAEASPVGLDRVIGYGRRQRREVQMDLFAREFLLPRNVARKLHVEEGLTASTIAARLEAPFAVIAQQLFDALLMPPIVAKDAEEKVERTLNDDQANAAAHRGKPYLLGAGPGTGKTQTLVARLEGLLREGVDPRRILVLTFSNKAAGEMADRIAAKQPDAAAAMWIGTFHAFGLDVVRRFKAELGFPDDPRMMDRTEAVELIEREFPQLGLVHYRNLYDPTDNISDILSAISRAKDEVVDETEYASLAEAMRQSATSEAELEAAEKALEVARVYKVYEQLKRTANCVDFGDLVSLPVRLMDGSADVRALLQGQYDHILVDEYQDVNRSSVRLLQSLSTTAAENLWVVGDAKQSIYRFRGASSFNISRFGSEDFSDGEHGRLNINYRSSSEIVDAFSQFAVHMKTGGQDARLSSQRSPSGFAPEIRTVDQAEEMTVALAESIAAVRAAGHDYRDQAVLCRGNEKLAELGLDLERLGIPVLFLGSLFERPEIKDLVALLSILSDRRAMGLVRVACWPGLSLRMSDVAAVLDHLREADAPPATWLAEPSSIPGVSTEGVAALRSLAAVLDGFGHDAAPWATLATILLDRTRVAADIVSSNDVSQRTRGMAIWQFLNFVRVQPAGRGLPITRMMERIRRLLRLSDERDLRQLPAAAQGIDAVRLMTMHGAKGLEFSVVHIPGMNSDSMPGSPQRQNCPPPMGMVEGASGTALQIHQLEHAQEQECLFYVALSRAKDRLFMYAPTQKKGGTARKLSPFLDRVGTAVSCRHIRPARELPPPPGSADIQLVVEGRLSFAGTQISLFESCPRRFFYTHILQVGGRRTSTAFMQMHEAVRTVFRSVIDSDEPIGEASLEQRVDGALAAHGLNEHGYAQSYREIALAMVRFFLRTREGHTPEAPTALTLTFGEELVIVRPDDVLVRPDGRRTLRRIQTGHKRSKEDEDVGAAAFVLAARQAFPDAVVELVHLSDERTAAIDLTAKVLQNRRLKLSEYLGDIRAGRFPADPSPRRCPNCPALFICGPTPLGTLTRSF
jgi:superfamily I DNA/RNA helicase